MIREIKRHPKEIKWLIKGFVAGIMLILKDKTLLFRSKNINK